MEYGADDAAEGLGHEEGAAATEGGEEVSVGFGDAGDDALEAEAAEVVGHAGLAVVGRVRGRAGHGRGRGGCGW
jgi:hypothetical protein